MNEMEARQVGLCRAAVIDITERKQASEHLQRAQEAADAANLTKSQYLANMSHELRTAMTGIMGMTDLALNEPLSPEVRDYLMTVKESSDGLLALLNDILGFSRVQRCIESPRGPEQPAAVTPIRTLRILLAEDVPANQKLATRILTKRGHQVEIANNGREALEWVSRENFDVVLMDVQMPIMDGVQATAAIRVLPDARKAKLPIAAMTAHAMKGDKERFVGAGMDGYLSKPITAKELIELVERLAEEASKPQAGDPPKLPNVVIASERRMREVPST